jgi:hypothetical protein
MKNGNRQFQAPEILPTGIKTVGISVLDHGAVCRQDLSDDIVRLRQAIGSRIRIKTPWSRDRPMRRNMRRNPVDGMRDRGLTFERRYLCNRGILVDVRRCIYNLTVCSRPDVIR